MGFVTCDPLKSPDLIFLFEFEGFLQSTIFLVVCNALFTKHNLHTLRIGACQLLDSKLGQVFTHTQGKSKANLHSLAFFFGSHKTQATALVSVF
jgi:hypothetical protein